MNATHLSELILLALAICGPAALFVLAEVTARFAVVYRRNNLAAALAAILFCGGTYLWGWLGTAAFLAGTLLGAWSWLSAIGRANDLFRSRA